ncbi:MAG: VWA domain-containing protein [Bacteroidales bacterium]|jgi:Ca-activated chloride channel family protein|nr:VWA domain-containing protein [Bacteroidales bacterium]NLK81158.1 VWA domain-containing protein [Bacteroidales bacterium]
MNESNFAFAHAEYFWLLYGLPILLLLFIVAYSNKKRKLRKLSDARFVSVLLPDMSNTKPIVSFVLLSVALVMLVFAAARPQFGLKLQEVTQKGVEVVVLFDVSNSMRAEDVKPNRIERAKMQTQKLIDKLDNDKISVVVFAGDAYTLLPLTTDIASAKMMVHTIKTDFIGKQGTSVGTAIQRAIRSFTDNPLIGKVIVLISDGEDHEEEAIVQAKRANEMGIIIHTVGMGYPEGAPIPYKDAYGRKSFMQDKSGRVVTTRLNENLLQEIAKIGNGIYARADFNPAIDEITAMKKNEFETKKYSEFDEKYQYFIAFALLFLILESLLLDKKNKYAQKFSLFK